MAILLTTVRSESDTTLGHRINRAAFVSPQLITRRSDDTQTFRSAHVKCLIFSHIIENESVVQRTYVQVVTQRKHPHLHLQPTQLLNPVSKSGGVEKLSYRQVSTREEEERIQHQSCSLCFPQLIISIDVQLKLITSFSSRIAGDEASYLFKSELRQRAENSLIFSYNPLVFKMNPLPFHQVSKIWRVMKSLRPVRSPRRWEEKRRTQNHQVQSAVSWWIHLKSAAFVLHN